MAKKKGCLGCLSAIFKWIWFGYLGFMIIGAIFSYLFVTFFLLEYCKKS